MKAMICRSFGPIENLAVEDVPEPKPGKRQLRVKVESAGVNFPDTLIVQGLYQFKPPFPFSPGSEIAGTVVELGEGVEGFQVGDRVMATPGWGGFAEQVVVQANIAAKLPDSMPTDLAGGFSMTYLTTYHALVDRARLKEGETLAVLGAAGGTGLSAVEIGKALGAKVIACASTDDKLELCRAHGADVGINYSTEDLKAQLKAHTEGNGVDVIYDPVGGSFSEAALRAIAWEGRFLVVGFAAGDIPKVPLNLALLKGCDIVGVFWGSFAARSPERVAAHTQHLLQLHAEGKLKSHLHRAYPLENAVEALQDILDRKVKGKAIITPGT